MNSSVILCENQNFANKLHELLGNSFDIIVINPDFFILENNRFFDVHTKYTPIFKNNMNETNYAILLNNILIYDKIYFAYNINYYNCITLYNLYKDLRELNKNKGYYLLDLKELSKEYILQQIESEINISNEINRIKSLIFCCVYEKYIGYNFSSLIRDRFGDNYSGGLFLLNIVNIIKNYKNNKKLYRAKFILNDNVIAFSKASDRIEDLNRYLEYVDKKLKFNIYSESYNNLNPLKPLTLNLLLYELEYYLNKNVFDSYDILMNLYYKGFITYPNTNGINYNKDKAKEIVNYIKANYGDIYRDISFNDNNNKDECIRVVDINKNTDCLTNDELFIYEYIKTRCILLFLKNYKESIKIYTTENGEIFSFSSIDDISYKNLFLFSNKNTTNNINYNNEYRIMSVEIEELDTDITIGKLLFRLSSLFEYYNVDTHIKAISIYINKEIIGIKDNKFIFLKKDYDNVIDFIKNEFSFILEKYYINDLITKSILIRENKIKYSLAFGEVYTNIINCIKEYSNNLIKNGVALKCSKCGCYIRLFLNKNSNTVYSSCFGSNPLNICSAYHNLKNIDLSCFSMYKDFFNSLITKEDIDI